MGWDRSLQHFFMVIEDKSPEAGLLGGESPLYSNLEDVDPFPDSLDRYLELLKELEIAVPDKMIGSVLDDGKNNVGNGVMYWVDE